MGYLLLGLTFFIGLSVYLAVVMLEYKRSLAQARETIKTLRSILEPLEQERAERLLKENKGKAGKK